MSKKNILTVILIALLALVLLLIIVFQTGSIPAFSPDDINTGSDMTNTGVEIKDSPLIISEVMSKNLTILQDDDGDYSDWIEIYNTKEKDVDLSGYALSDNSDELLKWRFPQVILKPGQYLIVFCSDKNRNSPDSGLHTNFKINKTKEKIYLSDPNRKIADTVEINNLPDDVSFCRDNADLKKWAQSKQPTPGFPNTQEGYNAFSETIISLSELEIWEVMSNNEITIKDEKGNFNDWVEIKNTGKTVLNLAGYYLSDDIGDNLKWEFPECPVQPNQTVLIFLSSDYTDNKGEKYLHANFALNSLGEEIVLSDPNKKIIKKLEIPELLGEKSYGRSEDASGYFYFTKPTPGALNKGEKFIGFSDKPTLSVNGGLFNEPFSLSISVPSETAIIRYTVDGSEPRENSPVYSSPIQINKNTVVRAASFDQGSLPGPCVTSSYIKGPSNNIPIISLATDPDNLWDLDKGIYVKGKHADSEFPYEGANFSLDWERPVSVEFFEPDGKLGFSLNAGVAIHGAYTRAYKQKSLAIDARSKYGTEYIDYPVFPERNNDKYQSIVIRNGGQDVNFAKLRDVLVTQLMKDTGIDYQAYRPVVLYLNGEYWGLYSLRESTDKRTIAINNNISDPDNIDIIEGNSIVKAGSYDNYRALINYVKAHDLSKTENYEYVKSLVDVNNYMDYIITEIYSANTDAGNIKYWRENKTGAKWRWILFDLDMAFRETTQDSVSFILDPKGTGSDHLFSTTLIMGLLKNQSFKDEFLKRFAYHINTTFEPGRVNAMINSLSSELEPEMDRNYTKWEGSKEKWLIEISDLRDFANRRPDLVKKHIKDYFSLSDAQMKEYGF